MDHDTAMGSLGPVTATTDTDAAFLDLLDPEFRVDSLQVRAARERNWYAGAPLGIAVLRHRECAALLRDRRLRRGSSSTLATWGVSSGPFAEWMRAILLNLEGEAHARQRALVGGAFGRRTVDALVPVMRETAHELVDRFAARGRCEFMAEFADPYPARVVATVFGIPSGEVDRFLGLATDIGLGFGPAVAGYLPRVEAALEGLLDYCDDLIARRRREPGDDLVSALVTAETDGDRLTTAELRSLLTGPVGAALDTTRNQLGLGLLALAAHPEQWALLAERPDLAAAAVDEIVRLHPTTPALSRWAAEDLTFQGLDIPAGTQIRIMVGAANTDPVVFGTDAGAFDITAHRPPALTFGAGPHFCLGAALARTELREALRLLAGRLPDISIDGPVTSRPPVGITGPVTLPLRFTPRSALSMTPNVADPVLGRRDAAQPELSRALLVRAG
jgi:cytochrome P450